MHFNPKNNNTLCDSILSTQNLWDKKTIIILGDVIFTKDGMDTVFKCKEAS